MVQDSDQDSPWVGGDLGEDSELTGGAMYPIPPRNALVSPRMSWIMSRCRGMSEVPS